MWLCFRHTAWSESAHGQKSQEDWSPSRWRTWRSSVEHLTAKWSHQGGSRGGEGGASLSPPTLTFISTVQSLHRLWRGDHRAYLVSSRRTLGGRLCTSLRHYRLVTIVASKMRLVLLLYKLLEYNRQCLHSLGTRSALARKLILKRFAALVSTLGKETLSLYVCIKCDSFDKYKIAFVSCVWLPQYIWPIRVILHRAMKRCLFMCVLNVFHLKKMNLHLLQSNVKLFLLASQDAVEVTLFTHSLYSWLVLTWLIWPWWVMWWYLKKTEVMWNGWCDSGKWRCLLETWLMWLWWVRMKVVYW